MHTSQSGQGGIGPAFLGIVVIDEVGLPYPEVVVSLTNIIHRGNAQRTGKQAGGFAFYGNCMVIRIGGLCREPQSQPAWTHSKAGKAGVWSDAFSSLLSFVKFTQLCLCVSSDVLQTAQKFNDNLFPGCSFSLDVGLSD